MRLSRFALVTSAAIAIAGATAAPASAGFVTTYPTWNNSNFLADWGSLGGSSPTYGQTSPRRRRTTS